MAQQNIAQYFSAYLNAATGGKVGFIVYPPSVADPTSLPKLILTCHECKQYLTTTAPTDMTIDFGVQEFVKLHAHNGEYDKKQKQLEQELEKLKKENSAKLDVLIATIKARALGETKAKNEKPVPKDNTGRKFR